MLATLKNAFKGRRNPWQNLFHAFYVSYIPHWSPYSAPGVNPDVVAELLSQNIFGFIDVLSGGAFKNISIFAMGIMPYINASIIMNLLTIVVPYFERLAKEGPRGNAKWPKSPLRLYYSRFCSGAPHVVFILEMPCTISTFQRHDCHHLSDSRDRYPDVDGEMITEKGIGNGISLIIFAGIVSRIPSGITYIVNSLRSGEVNFFAVLLFLVIAPCDYHWYHLHQRRSAQNPVQYAKRVVGRKVYGGQSTNIPMKVNQAGVIPIIFAMSILLPGLIASFFDGAVANAIARWFSTSHPYIWSLTHC